MQIINYKTDKLTAHATSKRDKCLNDEELQILNACILQEIHSIQMRLYKWGFLND